MFNSDGKTHYFSIMMAVFIYYHHIIINTSVNFMFRSRKAAG